MPDVRIPQELASRWVIENDNVRGYTSPRGVRYAHLDMLECIKPQLQPAYRVGEVRLRDGSTFVRLRYNRDDCNSTDGQWICLDATDSTTDGGIKRGVPTGLNVCDLVEHLKKGPVVCLTEGQAVHLRDYAVIPPGGPENILLTIAQAVEDWRENQKPCSEVPYGFRI